jgi:8-oxo-dGTP pyrophosphatase MutT (NUDIX family)
VRIEKVDWAVFHLPVPPDTDITLDGEHDRFEWVDYAEALRRCSPKTVRNNLRTVHNAVLSNSPAIATNPYGATGLERPE